MAAAKRLKDTPTWLKVATTLGLNQIDLKFSPVNEIHISQCVRNFVRNFQVIPLWGDFKVASKYFEVNLASFENISETLLDSLKNILKCHPYHAYLYMTPSTGNK